MLDKLKEPKTKVLYHLGADAGFYSELNNLFLCISYCLDKGLGLDILCVGKKNFHDKGWQDYFVEAITEVNSPLLEKYNVRPYHAKGRRYKYIPGILKKIHNYKYFTQNIFIESRIHFTENYSDSSKESKLQELQNIIDNIYIFNERTKKDINDVINAIALPEEYVAMHVRRGDKIIESDLYDVEKYFELLPPDTKNILLHSDDYRVIPEIKQKYPEYNFYSITDVKYQGYIHNEYLALPGQKRREIVINLLANVELFKNANHYIGSFDSNVGMFVNMYRGGKNSTDVLKREWYVL